MKKVDLYSNADLRQYNTFHIGGKAKYLFVVYDTQALQTVCFICKTCNIKFLVIGNGSNMLFDDDGYSGAIIVNRAKKINRRKNILYVASGTNINNVINYATKNGLSGLECFAGIPATIGGAIYNNMGAFESEIGNLIKSITCYDTDTNKIIKLRKKDCDFSYRNSIFKSKNYVILSAELMLNIEDKNKIKELTKTYLTRKLTTQPISEYSAGSVFKRKENLIPAKIIDELGLKGLTIGGASVSKKHSGFIINNNNATAKDVLYLIETINKIILDKYSTIFQLEIEYIKD